MVALALAAIAVPVAAQQVFVPQIDRGPGVSVPQPSGGQGGAGVIVQPGGVGGVEILQLPGTARPLPPAPPAVAAPAQPVARAFLATQSAADFPRPVAQDVDAALVIDPAALAVHDGMPPALPSVFAGVNVVVTPADSGVLPSVGAGSVTL